MNSLQLSHCRIPIPSEEIERFCRRHRIRKLSLFGSVLRDDFTRDSDVDVLIEFQPETRVGLFGLAAMELELSELIGRKVDLNTAGFLSDYFVHQVLQEAVPIYGAS